MKLLMKNKQVKVVIIGGKKNKQRVKLIVNKKKSCSKFGIDNWWLYFLWLMMAIVMCITAPCRLLGFCCCAFGRHRSINKRNLAYLKGISACVHVILHELLRFDVLKTTELMAFTFINVLFVIGRRLFALIFNPFLRYFNKLVKQYLYICCLFIIHWIYKVHETSKCIPVLQKMTAFVASFSLLQNDALAKFKSGMRWSGLYVDRLKYGIHYLKIYSKELKIDAKFAYSTETTLKDLHHYITRLILVKGKIADYVIIADKSIYDLNDENRFNCLITEFQINPNSVVLLPVHGQWRSIKNESIKTISSVNVQSKSVDVMKKELHITFKVLNVKRLFLYDDGTQLQDLHAFIADVFKQYNEPPQYRIVQPSFGVSLNNTKKFHVSLIEFNIVSPIIFVVPAICYSAVGGAAPFKKNTSKRGRKRKHSDVLADVTHKNNLSKLRNKKRRIIKRKQINETRKVVRAKRDQKVKKMKLQKTHLSFLMENEFDEEKWLKDNPQHNAGAMNNICSKCNAQMFKKEQLVKKKGQYSLCCGNGNIQLPKLPNLPTKLQEYLTEDTKEARYFRTHIRQINSALAFASMGCTDKTLPGGSFKIQGQVCHRIGKSFTKGSKFASIFFYDTDNELNNRMKFGFMPDNEIGRVVIKNLQAIIHELNPFYKCFKNAIDRQLHENIPSLQIVLKAEMEPSKHHKGCYNAPTVHHVAAILPGWGLEHSERDIVLYCKDKLDLEKDCVLETDNQRKPKIVKINQLHPHYDPTQYVTMFPLGTYGWSPDCVFTADGHENDQNCKDHDENDCSDAVSKDYDENDCSDEVSKDHDENDCSDTVSTSQNLTVDECTCNHNKCRCTAVDSEAFNTNQCKNEKLVSEFEICLTEREKENSGNNESSNHIQRKRQKRNKKNQQQHKQSKRQGKHFVKCRKYYKYQTMTRKNTFNYLQRYGKLWQQYIVDNWAKCDDNDLNYVRDHQKTFRRAHASGLASAIENDSVASTGIPTILPRSHTGSPRWFHDKFQDAMTIIQSYKKPDLFITFTCNPKWKEITDNLYENQTAYDRPALVARVFNLKKQELLDDILKKQVFGKVIGNVQVVEFQKRGLPHIHILIILDQQDSMKNCDAYDRIVSAEIPDPNKCPVTYERVMSHMIHFHTKQCWKEGTCIKHFPKDYCDATTMQQDGYPMYRRRSPQAGGLKVIITKRNKKKIITNANVVPYNAKLLLKYDCHINVEVCSTIRSVKYLYKYVYKGNDRTLIKVTNKSDEQSTKQQGRDEVQEYVDCRYISSIEAAYRLLEFSMHGRYPSVQPLMVHLPGEQYVVFDAESTIEQLKASVKKSRKTTLQAWFDNNAREIETPLSDAELGYDVNGKLNPRGPELLYHEYPRYYKYEGGKFKRRRTKEKWQLGRLHTAHPTQGQRWYLRILLTHVRGSTGYVDLLTYKPDSENATVFKCFKKRCIAEGLLKDDKEWEKALKEAAGFKMPSQLRRLFAMIVKECNPQNAKQLFIKYKHHMIEDMEHEFKKTQPNGFRMKQLPIKVIQKMYNSALHEICTILEDYNVDLIIHDLVKPPLSECFKHEAQVVRIEKMYNEVECQQEYDEHWDKMNKQQKFVTKKLIKAIYDENQSNKYSNLFFIDAPGGTGKTFVCNAILAYVRAKGDVALPCASSGIAATNFRGGRTVHSRFDIPLKIYHSSTCNLSKTCAKLQLIKEAKVIIWDEAPMQERWIMECVDRTLRELLENDKPFGGKTIIFSGDYRQVSCVVPKAGRAQIVQRTFTNSKLWKHIEQLHLVKNERIKRLKNLSKEEKERLVAFGQLLLQIGEGSYPNENGLIEIPDYMASLSQNVHQFIEEIYGNLQNLNPYAQDLSILKTAILTPKNEHMRQINEAAIRKFRGKLKKYKSTNVVTDEQHVCTYTTEFLNDLKINGLPEHELLLKIGAPVMVLRNYDPVNGVCNGTKGIVSKLADNVIEILIKGENDQPKSVLLHRRDLKPSDPQIGVGFTRHQFPISLAFAMTINKSQGQTLNKVGLFLAEPVFGHGQLYVALSRVIHPDNVKVFVTDTETQGKLKKDCKKVYTKNVVFHEILVSAGLIPHLPKQCKSTFSKVFKTFDFDINEEFDDSDEEWL